MKAHNELKKKNVYSIPELHMIVISSKSEDEVRDKYLSLEKRKMDSLKVGYWNGKKRDTLYKEEK